MKPDLVTELVCVLTMVGSSWYASVFLVVNAGLGAGLLNFPAAYHQCGGIVVAVSIQAVCFIYFVFLFVLFVTISFFYKL